MNRSPRVFCFIVAVLLVSLNPVLAEEATDVLTVADYLDLERVSDPQISPDGSKILYTRSWIDRMEDRWRSDIWIMNADGSRNRFLAKGSSPRWSPDGTRFAFLDEGELLRVKGKTRFRWVLSNLEPLNPVTETTSTDGVYSILLKSSKGDLTKGLPLVLLADQSTADAAEVLIAAIKDRERGTVLGRTTFGKGSVQNLIQLSNGSGVILTIAKYYRPGGEPIQGIGIKPSLEFQE